MLSPAGMVLLRVLLWAPLVYAFSSGGGTGSSVQLCDAVSVCGVPGTYPAGRRLRHTRPPRPVYYCPPGMHLVAPPERTSVYTLRTGDGNIADDPRAYVPGELVTLFMRVRERYIPKKMDAGRSIMANESAKYIGLLLYAVQVGDSSETKIGYVCVARTRWLLRAPPLLPTHCSLTFPYGELECEIERAP